MSARTPRSRQHLDIESSHSKRQKRSESHPASEAVPKQQSEEVDVGGESASEAGAKVQGTLYDAVAGRLDDQGFILDGTRKPVAPDEALFRRKNAPLRYHEDDKYFAHRHLPPYVSLPNSDLLKAIHAYASDFYASGALGDTGNDFQSMDETALMAMGILVEETCRQALGKTGDLAFVEGVGTKRSD